MGYCYHMYAPINMLGSAVAGKMKGKSGRRARVFEQWACRAPLEGVGVGTVCTRWWEETRHERARACTSLGNKRVVPGMERQGEYTLERTEALDTRIRQRRPMKHKSTEAPRDF